MNGSRQARKKKIDFMYKYFIDGTRMTSPEARQATEKADAH